MGVTLSSRGNDVQPETNRYRVRLAGCEDPDADFEIYCLTSLKAAKVVASWIGEESGHRQQLIEVWRNGRWVAYDCTPKVAVVYEATMVPSGD